MSVNHTNSEELALSTRGYRLLKKLGEGSYAKVYLSEFRNSGDAHNEVKHLACKIVDTNKAPKDFVKKFLPRELEILVKINHPHTIHVHSILQRKARYYIFMRYAEHGDLLDFLLKKGVLSEPQSRIWFHQLALAIQYLHEMEIAHRDLKCENILITNNYNIKLADFGFGRYVTDSNGKRITSETYCGSLSYAAPDVLKGSPYHPKIADIWALGIILYIMLNKAMPFDDTNLRRLYDQQINRRWKFRSKVADNLSDKVKKLITSLLDPDTGKRPKIDQVINSDWFAMDPNLMQLSPAEEAAKRQAQHERKKYFESFSNRKSVKPPVSQTTSKDDFTILKENDVKQKVIHPSIMTVFDEKITL